MARLHVFGFVSTISIDDTLLIGESEEECMHNLKSYLILFGSLGLFVHPVKSALIPSLTYTYNYKFGIYYELREYDSSGGN